MTTGLDETILIDSLSKHLTYS